jgi:hypothetical protein
MSLEQKIDEMIVRARDDPTLEMEVRFGHTSSSGFVSLVGADMFKALLKSMDAGSRRGGVWAESTPMDAPQIFASFYFDNGVRARYFSNRNECHHVIPVDNVLIESSGAGNGGGARVALKRERPVSQPIGQRPIKVRLHRRWSFSRARSAGGAPTFRYDLTEVATGADVASAKDAQVTYEVEIELMRTSNVGSSADIARSLLCKIKQLL